MKKFRLTSPKPFIPKEYDEQVAIFDYIRVRERQDYRWRLIFASMAGVRVSIGLARKMKRAGNNHDIPDIIVPVAGYAGCPGLFVELKREKGGHVSEGQTWFHQALREQGYRVEVAKGAKAAIAIIEEYLRGE